MTHELSLLQGAPSLAQLLYAGAGAPSGQPRGFASEPSSNRGWPGTRPFCAQEWFGRGRCPSRLVLPEVAESQRGYCRPTRLCRREWPAEPRWSSERRVFKRPVDLALFINRSKHNVQPFSFSHISSIKKYKEAGGGARGRITDSAWLRSWLPCQRQGGKEKLKKTKAELLGFF